MSRALELPTDAFKGIRVETALAAWALIAACALLQGAASQATAGGGISPEFLLRWRLAPITLWGLVVPVVVVLGRRWPLPGDRWTVSLAIHAVGFGVWMLVSNVLLRITDLAAHGALDVAFESVGAAVRHSPPAALTWIAIVTLVGRRGGQPRSARHTPHSGQPRPVPVRVGHRTYFVNPGSVRWIDADGDYARIHTAERVLRVRETLNRLHERLGEERFVRIHRSTLVNLGYIREIQPYFHGDHVAILQDGTERRIPRSRRDALRRLTDPSEYQPHDPS